MLAVFDEYGLFIQFLPENETTSHLGVVATVPENPFADPNTPLVYDHSRDEAYYSDSDYVIKYKNKVKSMIKYTAADRIYDLQWRIERAQERDLLGLEGETVEDVLVHREAIRRFSSQLEEQLLGNIKYGWDITKEVTRKDIEEFFNQGVEDIVKSITVKRITPLAFFSRFTSDEQAAILAASHQNPILNALIVSLQLADGVVLNDPRITTGVQALESAGLLNPGRAEEILSTK